MKPAAFLSILGTACTSAWMAVLKRARQYDFHQLPQYHRVAEECGEGTAQLFVYEEGPHLVALPLLLRPVDPTEPTGWQDATSVYGYGGPIASHEVLPDGVVRRFQAALKEALQQRRVVAVFSRLHPLLEQKKLVAPLGSCPADGETISIDLTAP
ncbi:MAG TPA: hypothetical protein VG095_04885, partial [Chthoniobacterales bacterium]|nr:hypothetical protein [Chthoniobacterales bacterium]